MFGNDDNLHKIDSVKVVGPEGEQLTLGFHTTLHFFGAGIYLEDHGYVLIAEGGKNYYTLDAEQITGLQADGLLPTPLPAYSVPIFEYLFGYSLWIILAVFFGWAAIKKMIG